MKGLFLKRFRGGIYMCKKIKGRIVIDFEYEPCQGCYPSNFNEEQILNVDSSMIIGYAESYINQLNNSKMKYEIKGSI